MKEALIAALIQALQKLITPEIVESFKKGFVCWLNAQVAVSENKIDDAVVGVVAQALGVDPSQCPAQVIQPILK